MSGPKVFGIGFHKTGTTSLGLALERLGYRVRGKLGVHRRNIESRAYRLALRQLDHYDAFQDNPWPLLYRQLDERCPGSRFILTLRPADRWIRSVVDHFRDEDTPMREWIYGIGHPLGNETLYLRRYERHNAEVLEYFEDRPQDLLVFHTGVNGWPELCSFLGRELPGEDFPHRNSRTSREAAASAHEQRRAGRPSLRSRLRGLVAVARDASNERFARGRRTDS